MPLFTDSIADQALLAQDAWGYAQHAAGHDNYMGLGAAFKERKKAARLAWRTVRSGIAVACVAGFVKPKCDMRTERGVRDFGNALSLHIAKWGTANGVDVSTGEVL